MPPQAWGGRYFLDNNDGGRSPKKSVFVFTPTYEEPRFFWIQMRFALDAGLFTGGTQGQPQNPFSEVMVNAGTAIGEVTVTLTQSLSAQAASMPESYVISGAPTTAGQTSWWPVMVLPGKKLVMNIENTGDLGIWVDCACAPLTTLTQEQLMALRWSTASTGSQGINARPNVFGFGDVPGTLANGPTRTPAAAAPAVLLPVDPTRRQFWVSNESDQRLALRFSNHDPVVTPGSESWDLILDAKGGANSRYQSPLDSYWGEVRGVWEGAPGGFALASSAIYFLQPNDELL